MKEEYYGDKYKKAASLNKVGHGIHIRDGIFRNYCNDKKLRDLVENLGWKDPVVPQSMYIFKQARIGGVVTSHQDSSFLFTEPRQTCLGLWLALQPAHLLNGCLWVRPGSHHEPVRRVFRRNPKYFATTSGEPEEGASQMIFEDGDIAKDSPHCMKYEDTKQLSTNNSDKDAPWEGGLPEHNWPPPCEGLFAAGFVPVEVEAGDLVIFPGTLDHLSLANYSGTSRHTFQLHLVDGPKAGVTWSKGNWLQYPEGEQFRALGEC